VTVVDETVRKAKGTRRTSGTRPADHSIASELQALGPVENGALVSATIALDSAPGPIGLFAAAALSGLEPTLWLQPVDDLAMVGIGRAWSTRADGPDRFAAVAGAWEGRLAGARIHNDTSGSRGSGPLLIGGLGFTGEVPQDAVWSPFDAASMVLPELLFVRSGKSCWLTGSYIEDGTVGLPDRLTRVWAGLIDEAVRGPNRAADASPTPLSMVAEHPDRPTWDRLVDRFAGAVGRGRLDKVVLARRVDLTAAEDIDVVAAIRYLAAVSRTSTTYAFTRGASVFIGATPERLISTQGKEFQTVAIAGTIRRDEDSDVEAALAAELLASDKDREEHDIVVETLRSVLEPVATEIRIAPSPVVARFGTVQHLLTTVEGRLKDRAGILALAGLLHPTPAVGGEPRGLALELIAEHEGFDRGWYAGPLGWVGADGDGEFVVALRCAVVAGRGAALFAGCGIVADSDAAREWEESRNKMQVVAAALGEVRS
jgi:salicylate biosynthesis isochorismate synthase